jgi:uncharacterized RDD family membrane protein YckC
MNVVLDTPRVVATPEGIELTIHVAGPVARARAWLVDALIRLVFYIAFGSLMQFFGDVGTGLFLVFFFFLEWAYPVLFEVYWQGATPGKRSCQLRVLHDDGTPVGWRASVARNTLRAVDFLPFGYGVGLVSCLLNRDFKRLGDLAAGTVVVHVLHVSNVSKVKAVRTSKSTDGLLNQTQPSLQAVVRPTQLLLVEQRAVIDFVTRCAQWSEQRAAELAEHAGSAVGNVTGTDAIRRLVGLAQSISGKAPSTSSALPKTNRTDTTSGVAD